MEAASYLTKAWEWERQRPGSLAWKGYFLNELLLSVRLIGQWGMLVLPSLNGAVTCCCVLQLYHLAMEFPVSILIISQRLEDNGKYSQHSDLYRISVCYYTRLFTERKH